MAERKTPQLELYVHCLTKSRRRFFNANVLLVIQLLLLFTSRVSSEDNQPHWLNARIATWFEDRRSAVTLTFDVKNADAAAAVGDYVMDYDMRGTFFWSMDDASIKRTKFSAALGELLTTGHEVGGMPATNKPLDVGEIERLRSGLQRAFGKSHGLAKGLTYSNPNGKGRGRTSDKLVVAARTLDSGLSASSPQDMLSVSAVQLDYHAMEHVKKAIRNGENGMKNSWTVIAGVLDGKQLAAKGTRKLRKQFEHMMEWIMWRLLKANDITDIWVDTFGHVARYVQERDNLEINAQLEIRRPTTLSLLGQICPQVAGELENALAENRLPIVVAVTLTTKKPHLPPEPVPVTQCISFDLRTSPVFQANIIDCRIHRAKDGQRSAMMSRCACREMIKMNSTNLLEYRCCWEQVPHIGKETMHMILHRPCPLHF